jgi:hypothetical protein
MGLRPGLAVLLVLASACGAANPGLSTSSRVSSARTTPSTPPSPSAATDGCMARTPCPSQLPVGGLAFDVDRETLVVFGGYSQGASAVLNETWEWNAATGWIQLHPATIPAARGMTAMAYDEARHVTLMYGGRHTVGGTLPCGEVGAEICSADTWTWNGTDWTQLYPNENPPPFVPTMTYDPSNAAVLLYNINGNVPETWIWDGASWDLKASGPSNPQPSRGTPVMASDPATRRVVMFGGFTPGGGDVNTMWSWAGQSWTSLATDAPFPKLQAAAAADVDRHALLGQQAGPAQTWAWDGVQWTQLHPLHEPTASASGLFADPKSHQVVLVGTNFTHGNAIEIWAWNGDDWRQLG